MITLGHEEARIPPDNNLSESALRVACHPGKERDSAHPCAGGFVAGFAAAALAAAARAALPSGEL